MAVGPNGSNLASSAMQRHPVDELQRSPFDDLSHVRSIYGSGLAMRLASERQLAGQVGGRLPGMERGYGFASNCTLDILRGEDTTIDFKDFLSRSENLPVSAVEPHAAMERKLGI